MMRFTIVQQPDGHWMIYDTQKGEVCLGTRSGDRPEAERWSDVFNSAHAAFRDEARSPLLPLPGERWVSRRKAMVLAALRETEITVEEVCRFYSLSRDELASWVGSFERHGVPGLRATRVQLYRQLFLSGSGRGDSGKRAAP
jgi:hypothetical protein